MLPPFVGPYRVVERVGSGAMGEVYLAEDARLGRRVALKRISEALGRNRRARRRFEREARAAAVLSHPNIATVYDVLEVEGESYIVMEYVEGEPLASRVERGPVDVAFVVELGIQLASALAAAHERGIVHRDLKPANVVVAPAGVAKILDFGLAVRAGSTESRITMTDAIVGTPAYMAPEQALGRAPEPRSDIYSLGLVLLECALGRLPRPERDEPGRSLRELCGAEGELSASLARVLERTVAFAPEQRYASAAELREALSELQGENDARRTRTRNEMRRRPGTRFGGRLRLAAGACASVVLALALYGLVVDRRARDPEPLPPVVAVLPLVNVSGDPSLDYLGIGIAHSVISSLSRLSTVTMISRADTKEFTNAAGDTRRIASDLGASLVVKGSIQHVPDVLRLSVHLVDPDDSVMWASDYEGSASDLFDLQRRLSLGLTEALRLNLTMADRLRLESRPTMNNEAYAEYAQGQAFLDRADIEGNLDRAIELFRRAAERDPDFTEAHAGLGAAYLSKYSITRENRWIPLARDSADRARRIDAENPETLYTLARIYQTTGRADQALSALDRAIELRPNHDDATSLRARILAEQGRVEEAAAGYRRAIEIRPNFWGHHRNLGLMYYHEGRNYEAVDSLKRVTELQPDLSWGFQTLGLVYHAAGDLDRAEINYRKAIELGGSPATYSNLGTIAYRRENFVEAVGLYQKAIEIRPRSATTHRNLGDAFRRLARHEEAAAAYERAIELFDERLGVNPTDARSLSQKAVIEAKLGRFASAKTAVEEAVDLSPADAQIAYRKSVVHALGRETKDALGALEHALELGYSRSEASEDEDLESIRSTPEFQALVDHR